MTEKEDDADLVQQAIVGEQCAFAALVARYRDMVYGTAYHALGHAEDAQDAAQEAFVQAYCRLGQLREPAKFAPWLRRLTLNLCTDQFRRRGAEGLPRPELGPSGEDVERLTTRLLVRDALSRLSDKTRLTVTLCYLGGYSHAEVAHFLAIPVNTVRSRLQHAKRQLREEMKDMVSETLNAGKPDEAWTRQVVEEAMRRGADALKSFEKGEAARHYDTALAALDALPPETAPKRLRMDALWQKGKTLGDIPLMEQALALAEELGDRRDQFHKQMEVGGACYNAGQGAQAEEHYQQAQGIARELGDPLIQAQSLMSLGTGRLRRDAVQARVDFELALTLLGEDDPGGAAYCRAAMDVLDEFGPQRLQAHQLSDGGDPISLIGYCVGYDAFQLKEGMVIHKSESCYINYTWDYTEEEAPALSPLQIFRVFWQLSHLWKLLDARVPVGGSWSGNAFSNTPQPLRASVTVLSDAEQITTSAGLFTCLLIEQVTTEEGPPSEANRELCGTRRAWYAPGVGLAQLHVRRGDGLEATIQLQNFSIAEESGGYLPLAVGNRWEYGWADLPVEYAAKEVYQVRAQRENLWYVEHYSHADRHQRRSTP